MPRKKQRVFVVDDHPVVRQGLSILINQEPDLTVCGTAADGRSALPAILAAKPAIAVLDISMPGLDGLELIKHLRAQLPKLLILVLSMHEETVYAERALRAGAQGYITKEQALDNVLDAIRQILAGQVYLSPDMTTRLLRQGTQHAKSPLASVAEILSDRELQVYRLIGDGQRTREIAQALSISIKTVETHRERIRRKLQLADSRQLERQALLWLQTEAKPTRVSGKS